MSPRFKPAGRPASPTNRRGPKPLPVSVAPKPSTVIATATTLPNFLRRGASGVVNTAPGPGELALDALCTEMGWAWGKVATYTKGGRPVVSIIIGTIIEGEVPEDLPEPLGPVAARAAEDCAMADVAAFLRREYVLGGNDGDSLSVHRPERLCVLWSPPTTAGHLPRPVH